MDYLNACFSKGLNLFLLNIFFCVWDPKYQTGIVPAGLDSFFSSFLLVYELAVEAAADMAIYF